MATMRSRAGRVLRWTGGAVALAVGVVAARPLFTPRHAWRIARPFHGPRVCNPYEETNGKTATTGPGAHWFRANFHAHSNVWEGKQPPCEVVSAFKKKGFELAEVSDHGAITDTSACNPEYIPVYEHGANLRSVHFSVIDAHEKLFDRYPIWQGLDQKQETIDRLKATAGYLVINHPCHNGGFSTADFAKLDGYDAVDVQGKFCKDSSFWDAALTSGYAAWAFGGDDAHNMASPWMGTRFVYVYGDPEKPADVIAALKAGHFVAVFTLDEATEPDIPFPASLTVSNGTIALTVSRPARTIEWRGENGRVLRVDSNVQTAAFAMKDEPYVRVEVETGSQRAWYQAVRKCE